MSLTEQDTNLIKEKLKEFCIGTTCISRVKIYELIKNQLNEDIDEYNFCQMLSGLISNKTIKGFEIRKGRAGGIHKEGAFLKHDDLRNKKIEEKKRKTKQTTKFKINNDYYTAKITIDDAIKFLTNVLDAETDAINGNIFVNEMCFKTKYPEILKNFITNWC